MTQPPTGLTRRRRRLSDEETERRMLEAGAALVNREGLTVSLEHLSLEEVIAEAQVSRSTVYRRWPYKDLFFSDLLKELARAMSPAAVSAEASGLALISQLVREHADWLETPEDRERLILEMIRVGAANDFYTMRASVEWRTYLALHATFLSVVDQELRNELREALTQSDRAFIERLAASWQRLATLLGYRMRPEVGATYETVATLLSADLRGHVLMSLASPELARTGAAPEGSAPAGWSPPALAAAAIARACFEPDPDVVWDAARIRQVQNTLAELDRGGAQG
jgi:AcrR family transcriptional regulator